MRIAIVTIGDEILIGQIVDTNSSWLSKILTDAGFEVLKKVSVGDNASQIRNTVDELFKDVDIIITTGGIGPTKDDITKNTLCDYFETDLIFDNSVLENIQNVISSFTSLNELTRNQAYVPKDYCTVIQNRVGTAPIMWFEKHGKVLISLPGVPHEMKYNMEHEIVPGLKSKFDAVVYVSQNLIVIGYTESELAICLEEFENNLPQGFGLAYLPSLSVMKLRLFVRGEDREVELSEQVIKLQILLGDAIISFADVSLEMILGRRLLQKGLTVGTAEESTGGYIAHLLTSAEGASQYFKGSIVSYSDDVMLNLLNVSKADKNQHTTVGEPVVREMAKGALEVLKTDCIIAISGIVDSKDGTDENPVGTYWVTTVHKNEFRTRRYQTGKFRDANIIRSANKAMIQLLEMIG